MKTNNELIEELTKLSLEKSCIIREITITSNKSDRHMMFKDLENLNKKIKRVKFELKLIREMRK